MQIFHEAAMSRMRAFGAKRLIAAALATKPANWVMRPILRRSGAQHRIRLPLAFPHVTYQQTAGPVLLLDPKRDMVARDIYWGGGMPQSGADARILRCVELLCSNGGTLFDVGSYSGLFALVAARAHPAVKAVAFEIVPENYLLIERNIIANDLLAQVEARLCGVSDRVSTLRMPAELHLPSLASSISIGSKFRNGISVPTSTLDLIFPAYASPFTVKIDVEGFERAVFEGAREFLSAHRPTIVCEMLPGSDSVRSIREMLEPLGYRYFNSAEAGLVEYAELSPKEEGKDWLFSARADVEELVRQSG